MWLGLLTVPLCLLQSLLRERYTSTTSASTNMNHSVYKQVYNRHLTVVWLTGLIQEAAWLTASGIVNRHWSLTITDSNMLRSKLSFRSFTQWFIRRILSWLTLHLTRFILCSSLVMIVAQSYVLNSLPISERHSRYSFFLSLSLSLFLSFSLLPLLPSLNELVSYQYHIIVPSFQCHINFNT